jgi:hypothetical protein
MTSCDRCSMPNPADHRTTDQAFSLDDFCALTAPREYYNLRTGGSWTVAMVDNSFPPIVPLDAKGKPLKVNGKTVKISPSAWLDQYRRADQLIWAPGEPQLIEDRIIRMTGWRHQKGARCINKYEPPTIQPGDPAQATPWIDHVKKVYPDDADHIIRWLAYKLQNPSGKINHALVLGGSQGIGKDTILAPVVVAVGPGNFRDISPSHLIGAFNSFVMSVILRVDEARDLGENTRVNRFTFYDHMKIYAASPPEVLLFNEKYQRATYVLNVLGLVFTTNYRFDGLYLPADDRRHYVAWSELTKDDFPDDYWTTLWRWYDAGGYGHVAAYLRGFDLAGFDSKAPPLRTRAMLDIIDASAAPENSELADAVDELQADREKRGDTLRVCTLTTVAGTTKGAALEWLLERKFRRMTVHRMAEIGYIPIRNPDAKDGLWSINGRRQVIYAPIGLPPAERLEQAHKLVLALTPAGSDSVS